MTRLLFDGLVKLGAALFFGGLLAMLGLGWAALAGWLMLAGAALFGVGMLAGLLSLWHG
jgi:hypothetical protein